MHIFKPGDSFYYFEVVRVLGAGAHGSVYEIRHRETGDGFALKTMFAADCVDPKKTARALAGAKGNYRIDHRCVVQVLDLNCEPNGMVWMRTELLQGYTFQELLARQGRLSLPFVLPALIEAAFGLGALHEAGIVHRDVKPSNLFYTVGRAVKVIDLSLAKVFPEGLETTVAGRQQRLGLGTPAYSAPEQLQGRVQPDVRFDIYGLGITAWEMLTGENPYAGVLDDMPELIKRQLTVMPPLLADVAGLPSRVDEVLRRAFAKDPAKRYGSMMEMARALRDLNAWVEAEARARHLTIDVPPGEPSPPGDVNAWRDYRAPEPTPLHEPPAPTPGARVIVAGATSPSRAAHELAATLPADPPGGLKRTLPLDEASVASGTVRTLRGTALLPAETTRPVAATPNRTLESAGAGEAPRRAETPATKPTPAPRAAAVPAPRETPAAVTRTQPGVAAPRRTPWPAVVVAVAVASIGSVALIVWLLGRGPTSASAVRAELPSAAAPIDPTRTPAPVAPSVSTPASASAPAAPAASTSVVAAASVRPSATATAWRPARPAVKPTAVAAAAPPRPAHDPPPPPSPTSHRVFGVEQ